MSNCRNIKQEYKDISEVPFKLENQKLNGFNPLLPNFNNVEQKSNNMKLITLILEDKDKFLDFEYYLVKYRGIIKRRLEQKDVIIYDIEIDIDNIIPVLTKLSEINFEKQVKQDRKRYRRFILVNIILWTLILLTMLSKCIRL